MNRGLQYLSNFLSKFHRTLEFPFFNIMEQPQKVWLENSSLIQRYGVLLFDRSELLFNRSDQKLPKQLLSVHNYFVHRHLGAYQKLPRNCLSSSFYFEFWLDPLNHQTLLGWFQKCIPWRQNFHHIRCKRLNFRIIQF